MTFNHNPIYGHVVKNLNYVSDAEKQGAKQIPEQDLLNVVRYISGDHADIMYTRAYGCSTNPALAAEQFAMDRRRYWQLKQGKKLSGQAGNKREILAHHCYASAHKEDNVTPELIQQILEELMERMGWKDKYRIFSSIHRNTDEIHIHWSLSAHSRDGREKIHMNNDLRYRIRIELNYICAVHGLSIIDDRRVKAWCKHNMPEYLVWLERIKSEGKIKVRKNTTKVEREARRERVEENREEKKNGERSPKKEIAYIARYNKTPPKRSGYEYMAMKQYQQVRREAPYRIRLYSNTGRRRGTLELLFLLVGAVLFDTNKYVTENKLYQPQIHHATEIQKMYDVVRDVQMYGIAGRKDLENKIRECGQNMNSEKKAIYYITKELEQGDADQLAEELQKHKNQLWILKKQYAAFKRIEDSMREVVQERYIERIYDFKPKEHTKQKEKRRDLMEQINEAERMKKPMSCVHNISRER